MKSDRILILLCLAGFLACAKGGSDLSGIDEDTDPPPIVLPDSGSPTDGGSSDSGAGGDSGSSSNGDAMPIGSISFFANECPGGWEAYEPLVGRAVVPNAGGNTLVISGTALAAGENRVHNHGIDFSIGLGSSSYVLVAGCCNTGVAGQRTILPSGTSNLTAEVVPSIEYMACEKIAAPITGTIPTGLTAYFESASCPATWSKLGLTSGRFVIGTPDGGTNDTTFGGLAFTSGESRTHTHPLAANWTPASHGITGSSGCCGGGYASASNYAYTGTSGANDATPPYLQLTHCRKQ